MIEVEDTGIGIPAGEQGRLFQRFFRSSTATEQAIPGTGLGLVISKRDRRGARRRRSRCAPSAGRGHVLPRRAPARARMRSRHDAHRRARRRLVVGARRRLRRGRASPSRATRTSRFDDLDADRLVDACRAVLAQVGEGDALAISCFWHSLVAVDARDRPLTPVLTWRDLAAGEPPALDPVDYHRRTGCFLHPAYWPAKIRRLEDEGVRRRALPLVRRLPAAPADRRSPHEHLDGERHRAVRPESARPGMRRRSTCSGSTPSQLPPVSDEPVAGVWPALGDGACSNVGAGCLTREPRPQ